MAEGGTSDPERQMSNVVSYKCMTELKFQICTMKFKYSQKSGDQKDDTVVKISREQDQRPNSMKVEEEC